MVGNDGGMEWKSQTGRLCGNGVCLMANSESMVVCKSMGD